MHVLNLSKYDYIEYMRIVCKCKYIYVCAYILYCLGIVHDKHVQRYLKISPRVRNYYFKINLGKYINKFVFKVNETLIKM